MTEISRKLACLYSAMIDTEGDSSTIAVPKREFDNTSSIQPRPTGGPPYLDTSGFRNRDSFTDNRS